MIIFDCTINRIKATLILQSNPKIMILDPDTNFVYFSELLWEKTPGGRMIIEQIMQHGVSCSLLKDTKDIWARDYMPIQLDSDRYAGYEFSPNYLYYDKRHIGTITQQARVCNELEIEPQPSGLIIDGGNIVKTSKGAIMTEKVFFENPQYSRIGLINRLEKMLETEVIFIPWDRSEIYGHADGVAREIAPGKLLMTNYRRFSRRFADLFLKVLSPCFDIEILDYKVEKQHPLNWCYINYLQVGNKIFIPQLTAYCEDPAPLDITKSIIIGGITRMVTGKVIEEDAQALEQFRSLIPDKEIIPISCPQIVKKGGALNCISWNIKKWDICVRTLH